MRILILSVGRDRKGPTADLVADYIKRCPWRIEIVEIPPCRQGSKSRRLADEAAKLRQLMPENAAVIMLDERGDDLESRSLAKRISRETSSVELGRATARGGNERSSVSSRP